MVTQLLVLKMNHLTATLILLGKSCLAVPIFIEHVEMRVGIVMNSLHTHTMSLNCLIYKMGIKLPALIRHCESNERMKAKV